MQWAEPRRRSADLLRWQLLHWGTQVWHQARPRLLPSQVSSSVLDLNCALDCTLDCSKVKRQRKASRAIQNVIETGENVTARVTGTGRRIKSGHVEARAI
ncbi:hypothetical protein ACFX13_040125 [Malus domestica]